MKNMYLILLSLLTNVCNAEQISINWDIYPNPNLSEPSLITSVVSQLRQKNISSMENMIIGECNQYNDYVNLSISNWQSAPYKSLVEVESYSNQLITQYPYRQSNLLSFPFGIQTYRESEAIIKKNIYTNTSGNVNIKNFRQSMYNSCIHIATAKYLRILSSPKYAPQDTVLFKPVSETLRNYNGSFFQKYDGKELEKNKTQANLIKKVDFSLEDMIFANTLINNDIRVSLPSDTRWIDFKVASVTAQTNFMYFMEHGGNNQQFALIGFYTKLMSIQTNNFQGINLKDENTLGNLQFDDDFIKRNAQTIAKLKKEFNIYNIDFLKK